ncbi:hypothetical protein BHE74_00048149 [Ensete ventricosum]|nr:hypothetical protein GW17_00011846 [Ensete ventricosum]RWW45967.1 hypothetical protein BHE74_00048149 [Ensete ventricosum]RZR92031.1 hypothetical protein BHM03_00020254 [Ensete ventricosum]
MDTRNAQFKRVPVALHPKPSLGASAVRAAELPLARAPELDQVRHLQSSHARAQMADPAHFVHLALPIRGPIYICTATQDVDGHDGVSRRLRGRRLPPLSQPVAAPPVGALRLRGPHRDQHGRSYRGGCHPSYSTGIGNCEGRRQRS